MDQEELALTTIRQPRGRFAPSPSGRMHLGNIFAALISRLAIKSIGGKWVLRIEDLDPQRSRPEYARQIEDDLQWLGLEWDEGGVDAIGSSGPYLQSRRTPIYEQWLERLNGLTYPCYCRRADIMATQAPHQSDGRVVYAGTCRPRSMGGTFDAVPVPCRQPSLRICVPDQDIWFDDMVWGRQCVNLANHCGDFLIRRADGAWAYQYAVVLDDALMGITQVVRGNDLLLSSAQQIFLYRTLGFEPPQFAHIPLLCNESGQRLSKRDKAQSMDILRRIYTPEQLIGRLGWLSGLIPAPDACTFDQLLPMFNWETLKRSMLKVSE